MPIWHFAGFVLAVVGRKSLFSVNFNALKVLISLNLEKKIDLDQFFNI